MFILTQSTNSPLEIPNGEGGIWTLAPLLTAYSLSRGAPSATWVLLQMPKWYFSFSERREWDSNPRALADTLFSSPPRYDHFDISPSLFYSVRLSLCVSDKWYSSTSCSKCQHFFWFFFIFLFFPFFYSFCFILSGKDFALFPWYLLEFLSFLLLFGKVFKSDSTLPLTSPKSAPQVKYLPGS